MSKKKLIRIAPRGNASPQPMYTPSPGLRFAFVSPPGERKQCTAFMACREFLCRAVWASVNGIQVGHHDPDQDPSVDVEKLRLLISYHDSTCKENLFSGKAILNILEKRCGWSTSTITTVVHPRYPHTWLLTGPAEWMEHPQLLSTAAWILRLAVSYGPINAENYDEFIEFLKVCRDKDNGGADNTTYVSDFIERGGHLLLTKKDVIFEDVKDIEAAYPRHTNGEFMEKCGPNTFVNNRLGYYSEPIKRARKRFLELVREETPPKKNSSSTN